MYFFIGYPYFHILNFFFGIHNCKYVMFFVDEGVEIAQISVGLVHEGHMGSANLYGIVCAMCACRMGEMVAFASD